MAHAAASATEYLPYARMRYFNYFCTAGSAVGGAATESTMSENFAPSFAFELEKIRLRLSGAHASVVDFMAYVSHHLGQHYNQNLISQAMNGVKDVLYQPDPTLKFAEGDVIHLSMYYSAANIYALSISGWCITQAPSR